MDGDEPRQPAGKGDDAPAIGVDGERFAHEAARGGRAERHDDARPYDLDLVVEPEAADLDLARVGLLVEASLAARLILEMLHRIGDVDSRALDTGRFEGGIEDPAGGADEGAPGELLLIARLLADQHHMSVGRTLAEYGLSRVLVKVATGAAARLLGEQLQRCAWIIDALLGK